MKNWMIWVTLAWFILSLLGLVGIYSTTRWMKDDVSQIRQDVNAVRNEVASGIVPYVAPTKPLPSEENPPNDNTGTWQPSWAK
jgi:hypothetical protein